MRSFCQLVGVVRRLRTAAKHAKVGLFAVVVLLAGSLSVSAPVAAANPSVRLVREVSSVVPDGTASFTVAVSDAPDGSVVQLDVYLPVDGDLDAVRAAELGKVRGQQFFPGVNAPTAAADADHQLTLAVPTSRDGLTNTFRLKNPGTYPVIIKLVHDGVTLSQFTTFLIRTDPSSRPVDVAVVVPIDAAPTRQPDGSRQIDAATRGRLVALDALATRVPSLPFTLAIRPDLIEALQASADLTDQALATRLAAVAKRGEVLLDTDIPMDPSASVRLGLSAAYPDRMRNGKKIIEDWLGVPVSDSGTRYTATPFDHDGLQLAQKSGLATLVTPVSTLLDGTAPTGPVRLADKSSGTFALVAGTDVTTLFTPTAQPLLAARHIAAEVEALSPQGLAPQPGIALVLSPDWSTSETFEQFLHALTTSAALRPVTMKQFLSDIAPQRTAAGLPVSRTFRAVDPIALSDVDAQVTLVGLDINSLASMTTAAETDPTPLLTAALSTAITQEQRNAYFFAAKKPTESLRLAVNQLDASHFTLGSAGEVPIPIRLTSDQTQPIQVRVHLSNANGKATFPDNDRVVTITDGLFRDNITINAREGKYPITLTVYPPTGNEALASGTITIQVLPFGGLGIALTASAGVILILWWFTHARTTRRRKRSLRDAKAHPAGGRNG